MIFYLLLIEFSLRRTYEGLIICSASLKFSGFIGFYYRQVRQEMNRNLINIYSWMCRAFICMSN